ncbi:acyltransferase [Actinomadura macrotermitis]|uniref:2,3,4,5-tetrahydropyridine-2,6-dicarboxylate N-acetyltransferase n=1 Tax=Actinomadura macrotermitis TaxID=2585200 RepID=A0A7K0BVD7_9ACTN|nr:acyltransferase [Actinomadura macrotermitis]MQY05145.1 2,3,4,5-tetrahydropyridine-2,6-dicarboxylate N-acetyltransferase [Actinomadura macrotermitis]
MSSKASPLRQLVPARIKDRARRGMHLAVHRGWEWIQRQGEITPHTPGRRRFAHLGEGACIGFPVGAIYGEPWISIGDHTLVGTHVTISAGFVPGLDLGPDVIVKIGSSCSLGRGTHIVGHQSIEIGDDVFTGPNVYITDQNHTYGDLDMPIGRQWPENNPVVIGDGCWIGTGAIILPGTRLGRNVAVAGGAVVRGEFPDHSVIGGVPAKVLRSYDEARGWDPPLRSAGSLISADELIGLSLSGMEGLQVLQDRLREESTARLEERLGDRPDARLSEEAS